LGCRLTDDSGRVVDVDMVRDSAKGQDVEAFDAWRVRWFLDPDAGSPALRNQIEAACLYLARGRIARGARADRALVRPAQG
jgi:hypothetical protein